ncbi:hypothetical protein CH63R_14339 [Colletotrichum higginsianum IMI 349063]|uniref:Uncharacterized protein n=1 Tax=Colletotrichum higginsianum (strain IMI 349063) TaxID=759273 RepID=A0A1B7XTN6_COLHI|nr:hypothetical protein CH63R_14339 [Colletotrichum higginsianum IMI 349063]OBR03113.1 hypothetical protein CH63R_14339 [Colletotrichum higginsianum IMI 349063]
MNSHQADASVTTTPTRNLAQRLPPNPDATDLDLEPTPRPLRADLTLSLVARQMAQSDTSSVASSSAASLPCDDDMSKCLDLDATAVFLDVVKVHQGLNKSENSNLKLFSALIKMLARGV